MTEEKKYERYEELESVELVDVEKMMYQVREKDKRKGSRVILVYVCGKIYTENKYDVLGMWVHK